MEEASVTKKKEMWAYRISAEAEWEELQNKGFTHGGDLDRTTGCIHLSDLNQVKMTLENFFAGRNDLYLLQIDAAKLGEGLVYESADGTNYFPHFYGPERSFVPLQFDTVLKAEKVDLIDGNFNLPTQTPAPPPVAATAAAPTTTGNSFSFPLNDDIPWDYANDDIDYDRFFGNNHNNNDEYDEFTNADCENFGFEDYCGTP